MNVTDHGRPAAGFTLIELMIVVAIIGILASLAAPAASKFQCRAKQTEAKVGLKAIYVAELAYAAEFDAYVDGATLKASTFIKGEKQRYDFVVSAIGGGSGFVAVATGKAGTGAAGDTWVISSSTGSPEPDWATPSPLCR